MNGDGIIYIHAIHLCLCRIAHHTVQCSEFKHYVCKWRVSHYLGHFEGLPGFEAYIPGYPGYSADFFDGKHYVLKGASWATADDLVRPSFRNWFQAHYPYVFAKFRCVAGG